MEGDTEGTSALSAAAQEIQGESKLFSISGFPDFISDFSNLKF